MERARIAQLVWGNVAQQTAIQQTLGLFDIVVGADVVYNLEAVEPLFVTVQALSNHEVQATLILCYIVRRVSENALCESATRHGFEVMQMNPALATAAADVAQKEPFRFMLLKRKITD